MEPNPKEELCTATDRGHQSLAKMTKAIIRDDCRRDGIEIPGRHTLFYESRKRADGGR